MPIALRYRGARPAPASAIVPWSFTSRLELSVGQVVAVPPAGLMIGRGEDAGLRIASNGVARRHARVSWCPDGTLEVEDLGSTNGIEVNGVVRRASALRSGDVLAIAGVFEFDIIEVPS